ncbi:sugar 3,4-ketoisomerase [Rosistilla oblonga]|uniref:sugar 3,4-ketoisomerase n=1 Tax=Rosistilla oblonga TaxID=2527990 RepID=UPI003A974E56
MEPKPKLITLKTIVDSRGELSFIENSPALPFRIERIFYMHSVPPTAQRGGHALKTCEQLLIPVCGCFTVTLNNGIKKSVFKLGSPRQGLYIPPLVWRELHDFTPEAVCLTVASQKYSESDYYRKYQDFVDAENSLP